MDLTEFRPELEALRALRGVVLPADADLGRHRERTLGLFTASKSIAQTPVFRWYWSAFALFAVGGLSYATGLSDIVSAWLVTVEPIDAEKDRVTIDHTTEPKLGFTIDLPIAEANDLVDAANSNELLVLEGPDLEGDGACPLVVATMRLTWTDAPFTVEIIGADGNAPLVEAPTER